MRCLIAALAFCALFTAPVRAEGVLVFAAASLKTALDEIAAGYEDTTRHEVTISYAASSVLARQIQAGAPADLIISANEDWMDVLQGEDLIEVASRVDLLGNGLVLIGAQDTEPTEIAVGLDLITRLNGGYLAMALVDAVPAGIYGKAALQNLGLWNDVEGQIAQTDNVRAALALVATGAAPLGIVYRSDAIAEDRVGVIGTIPEKFHPAIIYPAALTISSGPEALSFLTYLQGDEAQAEFLRQGFSLPEG
ncbi:molybdate transport system substrate-binding protein [Ruegeria halocynthiae]|uniref:Molybdate transport system substrate-binding protein n=1 Tax=Ruegeria halocynthiae TaxID=985054 RepID=A0A1H2YX44_9RHOB|nr:molybdate ABC transporter substrate-binding protein [Ruegeria halocynthiae]SDX09770.1 molybdate transport system substrate-binding protein [Ruegeria halocynthiae]